MTLHLDTYMKYWFNDRQLEKESTSNFRELMPEQMWWWKVVISDMSSFEKWIKEASKEIWFTYSGFIVWDEYVMTRYPRRAFWPVASIEVYQNALNVLASKLWVEWKEEEFKDDPKFRALLWLKEWYAEHKKKWLLDQIQWGEFNIDQVRLGVVWLLDEFGKKNGITQMSKKQLISLLEDTDFSKKHSVEEVSTILWEEFDLKDARIYTVGDRWEYQEPAVLIVWMKENKDKVYWIAEYFHQARIAIEDIEKWVSYIVETKYCEDPDKD